MIATITAAIAAKQAIPDQIIDSFAELGDFIAAFDEFTAASVIFSVSVFNPSN